MVRRVLGLLLTIWVVAAVACEIKTTPPGPNGNGGAGGCPTAAPAPLFTLHLTAADGPVPLDTTLRVRWSAQVDLFDLSDPSTWKSVDEGANVECNVDPEDPPVVLEELVCELWTSNVTEVEAAAQGYVTLEETLTPAELEDCEGFVPSDVELELQRDHDAGR